MLPLPWSPINIAKGFFHRILLRFVFVSCFLELFQLYSAAFPLLTDAAVLESKSFPKKYSFELDGALVAVIVKLSLYFLLEIIQQHSSKTQS